MLLHYTGVITGITHQRVKLEGRRKIVDRRKTHISLWIDTYHNVKLYCRVSLSGIQQFEGNDIRSCVL